MFTKRTTVAPFLAKEKTAIPPGSSKKIFFKRLAKNVPLTLQ